MLVQIIYKNLVTVFANANSKRFNTSKFGDQIQETF